MAALTLQLELMSKCKEHMPSDQKLHVQIFNLRK